MDKDSIIKQIDKALWDNTREILAFKPSAFAISLSPKGVEKCKREWNQTVNGIELFQQNGQTCYQEIPIYENKQQVEDFTLIQRI